MDARDRQERLGAWTTLAWMAILAVGVRIGIGYLPPVPEKDPLAGITLTEVSEPTTLEDLVLARRPIVGERVFLAWKLEGTYPPESAPLLVEIEKRKVVARLSERAYLRSFLGAQDGSLLVLANAYPDTLQNRAAMLLDKLGAPPLVPEERCTQVGQLNSTEGRCRKIGSLPLLQSAPQFAKGKDLALYCMEGMGGISSPWFQNGIFFPAARIAPCRSGNTAHLQLPIPGKAWFLNDHAALCLSPYGVSRVDLDDNHYEIVYPMDGKYYPDTNTAMIVRYTQDGRNCLGALYWDLQRTSPVALRIEMSDPPRVERIDLSIGEFAELPGDHTESYVWSLIIGVNYPRQLLLGHLFNHGTIPRNDWYVVDSRTGRIVYHEEATEMGFVGDDHLRVRTKEELPPLAGPLSPRRRAERERMGLYSTSTVDDVETTRTIESCRYLRLDDLIRKEGKR